MDVIKLIACKKYIFIASMFVLMVIGSDILAQEKVLITPMTKPPITFNKFITNQQNNPNDYFKYGFIHFNSELVSPSLSIKANDIIKLTFFDDSSYEVVVETITYNQNNTISISGRIKDHIFSTVTMTLDPNNFILILKDLKKNFEYTAHGSIQENVGIIKEVNINKIPDRIHLPPLEVR